MTSSTDSLIAAVLPFRRAPALPLLGRGDLDPAPLQRLAQQAFDLGVDASEIGRRRALEGAPQRRFEPQREGLFRSRRHRWRYW
jgi:hypothetical protein